MNQLGQNNQATSQKDTKDPLKKSTSWRKSYQKRSTQMKKDC
jgi:hypothetical protein